MSSIRRPFLLCFLALASAATTPAAAATVKVPADYPTIQAAIDAAPDNTRIEVAPGRYSENLDFLGKAVAVVGSGPRTVIDGGRRGSVVRFVRGEGPASVLQSFTITGGLAATGGGIEIRDSSPTIARNVIVANSATSVGSGVYISGQAATPEVLNNLLVFNSGVQGGDPHTIQVIGSSPRIINNTIVRNDSNAILTSGDGAAEIRNNILARNGSRPAGASAKGRGICDFASRTITKYNIFYRNVRAALLTAGKDYASIRMAESALGRPRLAHNYDAAPRFMLAPLPSGPAGVRVRRFLPSRDPASPSPAIHGGDPDAAFNNLDGSRNTIGFTGGPYGWPPRAAAAGAVRSE